MRNVIFLTILLIFLNGCASQEPAPIEFNTNKSYTNKDGLYTDNPGNVIGVEEEVVIRPLDSTREYNNTTGVLTEKKAEEQPMAIPGARHEDTKIIYHEVQLGETIELIAEDYDSSKEEIAALNELSHPYELQEFQIIKIRVSNAILNKKNSERTQAVLKNNQFGQNNAQVNGNYIRPIQGLIITKFGTVTKNGKNIGINIEAAEGTPVKSIASGIVTRTGNSPKYGNLVVVQLEDTNISVAYAHLKDLKLAVDQKLNQGDIIGHVGSTGNVNKAQLYLAIKEGDKAVNPLKYIPE